MTYLKLTCVYPVNVLYYAKSGGRYQKVRCTEQHLISTYFMEITATCFAVLIVMMYLFYVKYPYDKVPPKTEEDQ
jgi:hypothetical protein